MLAKRLTLSLLAVAAISILVSGASFALFTASASNVDNTFTAGTVSLGSPSDNLVDLTNIAPGDTGNAGTYQITYTGSLDAWLGLDTSTSGAIFGGATPLQVTISDGTNTYSPNATNQVMGLFTNGQSVTLSVDYAMPLAADNSYQGASGTVSMMIHAVQAKNNSQDTDGDGVDDAPISWN